MRSFGQKICSYFPEPSLKWENQKPISIERLFTTWANGIKGDGELSGLHKDENVYLIWLGA